MLEIQPVLPSIPVLKPKKIDRDDSRQKQPRRKKPEPEQRQGSEPLQHIDEIV